MNNTNYVDRARALTEATDRLARARAAGDRVAFAKARREAAQAFANALMAGDLHQDANGGFGQ